MSVMREYNTNLPTVKDASCNTSKNQSSTEDVKFGEFRSVSIVGIEEFQSDGVGQIRQRIV